VTATGFASIVTAMFAATRLPAFVPVSVMVHGAAVPATIWLGTVFALTVGIE
jgi:hypothetical protein